MIKNIFHGWIFFKATSFQGWIFFWGEYFSWVNIFQVEIFFEGWTFFRVNKFQGLIFLRGHRSSHSLNIWLSPNILGLVGYSDHIDGCGDTNQRDWRLELRIKWGGGGSSPHCELLLSPRPEKPLLLYIRTSSKFWSLPMIKDDHLWKGSQMGKRLEYFADTSWTSFPKVLQTKCEKRHIWCCS